MKIFEAVSVSLNLTPLDWAGNRQKILDALKLIRQRSNDELLKIVCFPELAISGPGCEDMFLSDETYKNAWDVLMQIVPETANMFVAVGLPVRYRNRRYQGVACVHNRRLLGISCPRKPATYGIHYESRWFSSWENDNSQKLCELDGRPVFIGNEILEIDGLPISIDPELIISPISVTSDVSNGEASRNAVVLCPTSLPFELGEQLRVRKEILDYSRILGSPILYSTLCGVEAGSLIFDGGSSISDGDRFIQAKRFAFKDFQIVSAKCSFDEGRFSIVETANEFGRDESEQPLRSNVPSLKPLENWETSSDVLNEEFARSVSLGLYGYLKKCRSKGFVLSLSGGADSASIALMVRLAIEFGVRQSGRRAFLKEFDFIPGVAAIYKRSFGENASNSDDETGIEPSSSDKKPSESEIREIANAMLTTVYQATSNSGETTRRAAQEIANFIGSRHYEFNIDPVVELYKSIVSRNLGRNLEWETDDLALQNIQARTRSPSVWLLANALGGLLLSTGNRSEVACGYATMDGDSSGCLSPIAGIDKAFLRKWLKWLEIEGLDIENDGSTRWKVPALRFVNEQQPTAELRPREKGQTDEGDLMPYVILDLFEKAIVRDKLNAKETLDQVWEQVRREYPDVERRRLIEWQIRFYQLWSDGQWKRNRYATGFHLDEYDLSPSSWTRFPIFSGRFQREIEYLRLLLSEY